MNEITTILDRVARQSYGRLLSALCRRCSVQEAEDALGDALSVALATWPTSGPPKNPEQWLMRVASRKAIDASRRAAVRQAAVESLLIRAEEDRVPDERLSLLFVCAHPRIPAAVRAPLMLQTVLGLPSHRIANAFLASPSAMAKRLVRAKQTIAAEEIPFEVPEPEEWDQRVADVLLAIYVAAGAAWDFEHSADDARIDLQSEALFLADFVRRALPGEAEAQGLYSLLTFIESRRFGSPNTFVPFDDQDMSQWDFELVREAERALGSAARMGRPGRFQWEAAIQSCHVARRSFGVENLPEVALLYRAIWESTGALGAWLGYCSTVGRVEGALAGLDELHQRNDKSLHTHQPYWVVRATLLAKAGQRRAAYEAFTWAMGLTVRSSVHKHLERERARLEVVE